MMIMKSLRSQGRGAHPGAAREPGAEVGEQAQRIGEGQHQQRLLQVPRAHAAHHSQHMLLHRAAPQQRVGGRRLPGSASRRRVRRERLRATPLCVYFSYYLRLFLRKEARCVCRRAASEGCQNPTSC